MTIPSHAVLITDDDGTQWLLATGLYGTQHSLRALYTEAEAESLKRRLNDHAGEIGVTASVIEAFLPGPELDPALEAP